MRDLPCSVNLNLHKWHLSEYSYFGLIIADKSIIFRNKNDFFINQLKMSLTFWNMRTNSFIFNFISFIVSNFIYKHHVCDLILSLNIIAITNYLAREGSYVIRHFLKRKFHQFTRHS